MNLNLNFNYSNEINKETNHLFISSYNIAFHEIMDVKDVLKGFVDHCNERADYFQYKLSSNSVLEWFGRTFRGNKNIEQYLRHEIWPQYAQHFSVAVNCDAFEAKPSHLET